MHCVLLEARHRSNLFAQRLVLPKVYEKKKRFSTTLNLLYHSKKNQTTTTLLISYMVLNNNKHKYYNQVNEENNTNNKSTRCISCALIGVWLTVGALFWFVGGIIYSITQYVPLPPDERVVNAKFNTAVWCQIVDPRNSCYWVNERIGKHYHMREYCRPILRLPKFEIDSNNYK